MKVVLFTDNSLAIPLEPLCELLNAICRSITFSVGKASIRFDSPQISCPHSYDRLPRNLIREAAKFDLAVIFTAVQYDNNYFYEFELHRSVAIVSFNGWNLLTDLPITNGAIFFIAVVLNEVHHIGDTHYKVTGCVNDYRQDKTTVDICMRAAFLCRDCREHFKPTRSQEGIMQDVEALLDHVSEASRSHKDVLSVIKPPITAAGTFDIFLCHNSDDKPAIRRINGALKNAGIATWLDEEQLPPGVPWQPRLENQIERIRNAAVFVGKNGFGPWQKNEVRAFLSEFMDRGIPVIPVILKDAVEIPQLPVFLKQMTYIDLRKEYQKNLSRLIDAVGRNPS
jgi:TIR domain